jgi:hypothetical protein
MRRLLGLALLLAPLAAGCSPRFAAGVMLGVAIAKLPPRCREHGLPDGYVHARFTFAPTGRAQRIVIDSPGGVGPDALACLRDTLSHATVPPFTGAPVVTGHTWFLR